MSWFWQIAAVAATTIAIFFGTAPLLARVLRLDREKAQLAGMGARFFLVVLLVAGLLLSGTEHRLALVFTVGAASFAAALIDGARHYRARVERKREAKG